MLSPTDELQSAFSIYKKTLTKKTPQKKKRLQHKPKDNFVSIKKRKHLIKIDKDPEEPPTLVELSTTTINGQLEASPKKKKKRIQRIQTELNGETSQTEVEPTPKKKKKVKKPLKIQALEPNDDPIADARFLFQWLIAPLSPETFFANHWEQKALHIKRAKEQYYKHILDSSGLDAILRNNSLYYTRNVDVVSYENGQKQVFNQEGRATTSALWDYYSNGCSIRILNPQTYNRKIHLLISSLQEYFGTMVGTNVYLTPPGSQGFAPHYDDIEAFVIQLEGRKHWKLYEPKGSDVLARYSSPNLKHEDIGDPAMTLTLEAGDLLYFPRGTIHEGYTDEEAHSLHITVSVYQQTSYADLLEHVLPKALKEAAENEIKFRQGLPLNYLKQFGAGASANDRTPVIETVKSLLHSLVKFVDIDNAADQLGRKFMRDSLPPLLSQTEIKRSVKEDGTYLKDGRVLNSVEITPDTRIRLLRYYCIRLVIEDAPKLYYSTENSMVYHGEEEQWLELDPTMVPAIQKLQATYPDYVGVEELPMEDVMAKMQLVSDLWEHGLLVTEQPLESFDD